VNEYTCIVYLNDPHFPKA